MPWSNVQIAQSRQGIVKKRGEITKVEPPEPPIAPSISSMNNQAAFPTIAVKKIFTAPEINHVPIHPRFNCCTNTQIMESSGS